MSSAKKISYKTKYISLFDAKDWFDSEDDLILALKEKSIVAEGRPFSEDDLNDYDDGALSSYSNSGLPELPYKPISTEHWIASEITINENKLYYQTFTNTGQTHWHYYNDIRLNLDDLKSLTKEHDKKPKTKQTKTKQKRLHPTPYLIGKAYIAFEKSRKKAPQAQELWDFIINDLGGYGFDDYIDSYNQTNEPALEYTRNSLPKHISRRNFDNIVSKYRTGKKQLPA